MEIVVLIDTVSSCFFLFSKFGKLSALLVEVEPGVAIGHCAFFAAQSVFVWFASTGEQRDQSHEAKQPNEFTLVTQDRIHLWQVLWLTEAFNAQVPRLNEAKIVFVPKSHNNFHMYKIWLEIDLLLSTLFIVWSDIDVLAWNAIDPSGRFGGCRRRRCWKLHSLEWLSQHFSYFFPNNN